MWEKISALIRSTNRSYRIKGWTSLRTAWAEKHWVPTAEQLEQLNRWRSEEEDDGVWRLAVDVLLGLLPATAFAPSAAPQAQKPRRRRAYLADWLWDPFRRSAIAAGVSDPGLRRDADALIVLARCLSHEKYKRTEFLQFPSADPQWSKILCQKRLAGICLVGRLGLFGEEAVSRLSMPDARFSFLIHQRPKDTVPGQLHRDYYCLRENLGDGTPRYYRTKDEHGTRTDFGLVQRYVVFDGIGHVVVVVCAGGSSLGTYGAVQWAADRLFLPTHPYSKPIPTPPHLGPNSRLEALLDVRADLGHSPWPLSHLELRSLYVDQFIWSTDLRQWRSDAPKQITLVLKNGDPDRPLRVLFNGKKVTATPAGQAFHLLVRLCQVAAESPTGVVDVARLAEDEWIWSGKRIDETTARRNLSLLKFRHLHDALSLGDEVRLHAHVVIRPNE